MKNQSYHIFWQRLHKTAKDKEFPLRVMFEVTYKCNFRCKHCYVPEDYKNRADELTREQIFAILDQLRDMGCFYLGFTGGEPFVRSDIMDILWYAKKKGVEVIIYTNGSLIDKNIASELARLRPNKVDIAIPAMSKDAFEKISGVAGSRDKVFKAIELLHNKGVNLGFKTCALKENESEIKDIQDFAGSLKALHRLDDRLSARLDGNREPFKYREQKKRLSVIGNRLSGKTDCQASILERRAPATDNLFRCGVGQSQAAITPLGELKMCVMIDYPRYKINTEDRGKAGLKKAWGRLKELVRGIRPDENYRCDKCELESYCKWCPAKAWLENKSFTNCDSESRQWAEIRRRSVVRWLRVKLS